MLGTKPESAIARPYLSQKLRRALQPKAAVSCRGIEDELHKRNKGSLLHEKAMRARIGLRKRLAQNTLRAVFRFVRRELDFVSAMRPRIALMVCRHASLRHDTPWLAGSRKARNLKNRFLAT